MTVSLLGVAAGMTSIRRDPVLTGWLLLTVRLPSGRCIAVPEDV